MFSERFIHNISSRLYYFEDGEMAEWLKALLSKSSVPGNRYPGFESLSLRQVLISGNGIVHNTLQKE